MIRVVDFELCFLAVIKNLISHIFKIIIYSYDFNCCAYVCLGCAFNGHITRLVEFEFILIHTSILTFQSPIVGMFLGVVNQMDT